MVRTNEINPFQGWGRVITDQGFIRQTLGVMNRTMMAHSHQPKTQCTWPVPAMPPHQGKFKPKEVPKTLP